MSIKNLRRATVWGRSVVVTRDPAGGFMPNIGALANLELIQVPAVDGEPPELYVLDLEVIDNDTGLPPAIITGGFWVTFGTNQDVRERLFTPGIHVVIGRGLRVRVEPQLPTGAPISWTWSAHATVTAGVMPSYTWSVP